MLNFSKSLIERPYIALLVFCIIVASCNWLSRDQKDIQSFRNCKLSYIDNKCSGAQYSELWIDQDTVVIIHEGSLFHIAGGYSKIGDTLRIVWPDDSSIVDILFKSQGKNKLVRDITFKNDTKSIKWLFKPFKNEVEIESFQDLNLEDVYKRRRIQLCL